MKSYRSQMNVNDELTFRFRAVKKHQRTTIF